MVRPTLLLALLTLAACDSTDDLRPIPEDMLVDLTDDSRLRVTTDSHHYCGIPIFVDSKARPAALTVFVRGAAVVSASCDALVPGVWTVQIPAGDPVQVSIHHRGAVDLYEIDRTDDGLVLSAVRTSTTRLAD
ncbi:hypothetical protein [Rubrivirga sp. IMCC43871]|uniref:hypothetical protein n=1 Tax=Rubrivirga sp. IMCC43871 TaxID=3391575 RepID=UPI00398FE772